jgi:hypothetical protein
MTMVGRVRVELTTSRLSGVRSNHLSYRPPMPCPAGPVGRRRQEPAQASDTVKDRIEFPVMKGHEDGGNVLWKR